jgi:hypothetical protein
MVTRGRRRKLGIARCPASLSLSLDTNNHAAWGDRQVYSTPPHVNCYPKIDGGFDYELGAKVGHLNTNNHAAWGDRQVYSTPPHVNCYPQIDGGFDYELGAKVGSNFCAPTAFALRESLRDAPNESGRLNYSPTTSIQNT